MVEIINKAWKSVKNIAESFSGAFFAEWILHDKKNGITEAIAGKAKEKLTDTSRVKLVELFRIMEGRNKIAAENLQRHQRERNDGAVISYKPEIPGKPRERYRPGSENTLNELLAKTYLRYDDSEMGQEARLEMFEWLGEMSDEKFDATLEAINHDVVMQYIRLIPYAVKDALTAVMQMIEDIGKDETLHKLDVYVATQLDEFIEFLDSKGIYERTWWGGRKYPKKLRA